MRVSTRVSPLKHSHYKIQLSLLILENEYPSLLALPQKTCHEKPVPSNGAQTTETKRLKIAIKLAE